MFQIATQRCNS